MDGRGLEGRSQAKCTTERDQVYLLPQKHFEERYRLSVTYTDGPADWGVPNVQGITSEVNQLIFTNLFGINEILGASYLSNRKLFDADLT